jgi:hypothetical protein
MFDSGEKATTEEELDIHVIALEETEFFQLEESERPYIRGIHGVYFYDKNCHTYCCELSPSYYFHFLYYTVIVHESVDDSVRERLSDKYETLPSEDMYINVYLADALQERYIAEKAPFMYHHEGSIPLCEEGETVEERYMSTINALYTDFKENYRI